jgi:addiction module RelE/StbE family toxin
MKRQLIRSEAFVRAARRLSKKQPDAADKIRTTLDLLAADAFHPQLKTHKLKGDLAGSWSCSVGHDLRIVFEFAQQGDAEAIALQTIGTHDEVY